MSPYRLVYLFFLIYVAVCEHPLVARYDGHRVIRLSLPVPTQTNFTDHLTSLGGQFNLDVWASSSKSVLVQVPPSPTISQKFEKLTKQNNIGVEVVIEDIQALIDSQFHNKNGTHKRQFDFTSYHRYDTIVEWMQQKNQEYPGLTNLIQIGTTLEGRPIIGLEITTPSVPGNFKPGIFYNAGIHAREWIGPASMCWIINELLTGYGYDPLITELVNQIKWTIVPIDNIDGYEYSHTTDRLWRKTRNPNPGPHNPQNCVGIDPSRNWDNLHCGIGSSDNPCSQTYCGEFPWSEPEPKALADWVCADPNIIAAFDFHSFGQMWLGPHGTSPELPPDYTIQQAMGLEIAQAIQQVHGTLFDVGPAYTVAGPTSGTSIDYYYEDCGVLFGGGVELRDNGQYGFMLPPEQIIPQGEELMEGVKVMARHVLNAFEN